MESKYLNPIFFNRNRVRRIYTGGKLFSEFFGDNSKDGFYPEEWVCSSTAALNEGGTDPKEGISLTEDNEYFDDILLKHKSELLGEREELGILVKILDSGIRLPVQAHPDKEFSKKYLSSEHGKAESWIILETRENAAVYFGFKEKITLEEFENALNKGENAITPLLNKIPVKPGDVFFVPAKSVHAIGYGCMLLEIQEPTDFTIQPEATCGDCVLSDNVKYLGLSKEDAFKCFDMDLVGESAIVTAKKIPKTAGNSEMLISYEDTPCFSVNRYNINCGETNTLTAPAIYVVTSGAGTVEGNNYKRSIKKGDYFFMPFSAKDKFKIKSMNSIQIVECLPPKE